MGYGGELLEAYKIWKKSPGNLEYLLGTSQYLLSDLESAESAKKIVVFENLIFFEKREGNDANGAP